MSEIVANKQMLDEGFIAYLESVLKRDDRAILAHLRRGLGREAGTAMEMFPYVARFVQNSYRSDENAYFLVAALFGLYPTYSWKTDEKGRNNLGKSISLLNDESPGIEKRFTALLNSDEEDLPNHLRQIISLLKSKDKPVNWHELLIGIKFWNRSDKRIQREWAKGFWGNKNTENIENIEKENKSNDFRTALSTKFAPSNLNRSDTGSPKDCIFGGFRRARISSQCFKRAIRWESNFKEVLEGNGGSVRTRRLIVEIAKQIATDDKDLKKVTDIISAVFKEGGIERPEKGEEGEKENTRLVFFMNEKTISEMADHFKENWENLINKETKDAVIKKLGELLAKSVKSPDIALFGRMLEIKPDKPFGKLNLGMMGSSQVAHAISTHKVGMEFDYFTAVDDLLEQGEVGAGMLGTVEFNSACFYRYLNVDVDLLGKNLGDEDLTRLTVKAFIRSAIEAIPTGKQNSFATHEKPNFVLAVVRDAGFCSLANSFETPAKEKEWNGDSREIREGLVRNSIEKLAKHWESVTGVYGDNSKARNCVKTADADLKSLKTADVGNLETLISNTMSAIFA